MSPASDRRRSAPWRTWFLAFLAVVALVGVVLHLGDIRNFLQLAEQVQPLWLLIAIALQLSTYVSLAFGWRAVLVRARAPQSLGSLMQIAITKFFADQALPGAGMGGNVLLVDQLGRLGVPRGTAVATLLISMVGYYAAYAILAILALFMLWLHGRATPLMVGVVTSFLMVAIAIPSLALWLRHRGSRPLPSRIENIGFVRKLLDIVGQAPANLLRDRQLLVTVALCNMFIFLADILTLAVCLRAFAEPANLATSLIAFIMASVAVTLGPIPLGLGSFEFVCTGTLKLLGVPIETALAATLLLRTLTLWLPLLPGLFLIRRVVQ